MYRLFLDDIRSPPEVGNYMIPVSLRSEYRKEEWVVVRNYDEFINTISSKGLPTHVSFDHDLADIHYDPVTWKESFRYQEKTGYDCAKWLIEYCIDNKLELPICWVHSANPVGRENILNILKNFNTLT